MLAAALGLWAQAQRRNRQAPAPQTDFPVLPLSVSPFLNTGPEARHVGSEVCRSCHDGPYASFRRTGMGRSMAEVDPAHEPPDGAFGHLPSRRRYEVRRKEGRLWHRELLHTGGAEDVLLSEYPVRYVVGSGRHSRTYLVEAEGFLVESPVTWYASRQAWGMSPGYDQPDHWGFERAIGESCLFCHAGQAQAIGASLHQMHIAEPAIGCERCHGPGSLHVEHHTGRPRPAVRPSGAIDYTIVNPAHLPRELAEAVCQHCHLKSSAFVIGRRRTLAGFRPGLPLQDFRQDYRLQAPDASMTVVGHVEQMHLSRCYQASDSLTCTTCHDPHGLPRPKHRADYYSAICLSCHRTQQCTVDERRRRQESPDNNCVHCHMPAAPTEIPHLAFTHHRIGIHDDPKAAAPASPEPRVAGDLEPFLDLSRLGDIDRRRSLGLGYLELANHENDDRLTAVYRERALDLLSAVRAAGLRDAPVDSALARLRLNMGLDEVLSHAESALALPDLIGQDRCNALFLAADAHVGAGRYEKALESLREVTRLRRHPIDWLLRADCEKALGNPDAAREALETAVRINPRLWKVQQALAEHYRREGDPARADWHQQRAVP
jgi:predicted CXXCH cytochrome family protein